MIMCMSDILCVTNRMLCTEDFLTRIERIAAENPRGIILREKDMSTGAYRALAKQVLTICERYHTPCILHGHVEVAKMLGAMAIHLPLSILRALDKEDKKCFTTLGASCHSIAEAKEAEALGCTYIIAGHIFETDCKKGLAGRGLHFLKEVCEGVSIPVYAIGGISAEHIGAVRAAGAAGACVMSGIMTCEEPEKYLAGFRV